MTRSEETELRKKIERRLQELEGIKEVVSQNKSAPRQTIDEINKEIERIKKEKNIIFKKSKPINYDAGGSPIPAQTSLGAVGARSPLAGQLPNIPFPDDEEYAPYWTRPYRTGSRQEVWKGFIDEGMHIQNPRLREIHRLQMAEKRAREAAGIYPPVIPSGPNPWDATYRG